MPATKAKPNRTLEVMARLDRSYIPAVLVRDGRKADAYAVFTSPDTIHWQHRGDHRSYRVTCVGGVPAGCTCPAGTHGKACRHVAASRKLVQVGELVLEGVATPDGWMHTTEAE